MKYAVLFIALFCVFVTACHRPVAYFQRTPYTSARTQPVSTVRPAEPIAPGIPAELPVSKPESVPADLVASQRNYPAPIARSAAYEPDSVGADPTRYNGTHVGYAAEAQEAAQTG